MPWTNVVSLIHTWQLYVINILQEKGEGLAETTEPENGLYTLTSENFDKHVEMGLHLIKFYAPW